MATRTCRKAGLRRAIRRPLRAGAIMTVSALRCACATEQRPKTPSGILQNAALRRPVFSSLRRQSPVLMKRLRAFLPLIVLVAIGAALLFSGALDRFQPSRIGAEQENLRVLIGDYPMLSRLTQVVIVM